MMNHVSFTFSRTRLFPGFDGKFCKVCPSVASDGGKNQLIAYQKLLLSGSDVVYGMLMTKSIDGGKTFSEHLVQTEIADVYHDGLRTAYSAFLHYHKHSRRWFALGCSEDYADDSLPIVRAGTSLTMPMFYPVDFENCRIKKGQILPMPFPVIGAVPMGQIIEEENGDILVPFSFTTDEHPIGSLLTARYRLTDTGITLVEAGMPIVTHTLARGYAEPSIAKLNGKYYMTIRTDEMGMFAVSDDGLTFAEPRPWTWEDGSLIGNCNTQQHWIVSQNGLFLAYTRSGAHNDHVFRNRAPIFMARFDEERGCLLRDTEVILVPELGARLGNFAAFEPTDKEAWLITAEWMQPAGCEAYGSDNSLWLAKVQWQ